MTVEFGDIVRLVNVTLILLYFVYMLSLKSWWETRPREERMILISHPILLSVTAYASVEALIQDLSPGTKVFLYTPSLILCVYALYALHRKIRNYKKREGVKNANRYSPEVGGS